jgi:hypothetical protein
MSAIDDANRHGQGGSASASVPIEDGISMKLRQYYSSLEQERIPDNLLFLLDKLEAAEKAAESGRSKGAGNERS